MMALKMIMYVIAWYYNNRNNISEEIAPPSNAQILLPLRFLTHSLRDPREIAQPSSPKHQRNPASGLLQSHLPQPRHSQPNILSTNCQSTNRIHLTCYHKNLHHYFPSPAHQQLQHRNPKLSLINGNPFIL